MSLNIKTSAGLVEVDITQCLQSTNKQKQNKGLGFIS